LRVTIVAAIAGIWALGLLSLLLTLPHDFFAPADPPGDAIEASTDQ
jgi:hypothetical protein